MNHLKDFSKLETRIKYSIDKIQRINKYFEKDEFLSYVCYINANPDMDPEELKYCINYLEFLKSENEKKLKIAMEQLDTKNKIETDNNEQSNQDRKQTFSTELEECDLEQLDL